MYIGAWTEYRLALEKQQQRSVSLPSTGSRNDESRRRGGGIYHPSLPGMGGREVSGLPDRESFRKTLQSALCSNLAIDDAEQITQALEPLLQRLPTTTRTSATRCGRARRARYIGCYPNIRGESTRSGIQHSSDGVWSVQSGFSTSSAPPSTSSFVGLSGIGIQEQRKMTSARLPRLVRARSDRSTLVSKGVSPHRHRDETYSKPSPVKCSQANQGNWCDGNENGSEKISTPHAKEARFADGNQTFDGGKAATLLRVARRRDPMGLKADFRQFWVWKARKNPLNAVEVSPRSDEKASRTVSQSQETATPPGNRGLAREQHILDEARSRLEELENMKMKKMKKMSSAKSNKGNRTTSARKDTLQDQIFSFSGSRDRSPTQIEDISSSAAVKSRIQPNTTGPSEETAPVGKNSAPGDGGASDPVFDAPTDMKYRDGEKGGRNQDESSEPIVVVPELELTESRIRQVGKYFSGEEWRRRYTSFQQGHHHLSLGRGQDTVVSGDAGAGGSPRHAATAMSCAADVDGHSTAKEDARRITWDSYSHQSKNLNSPSLGSTTAAGRISVAHRDSLVAHRDSLVAHRDSPVATATVESVASADRGEREVAISVDAATAHPLEETNANPPRSPGKEPSLSFPAPVCYGDTLEDLVCWTKQLDFKAIEGY